MNDEFLRRHIGPNKADQQKMLEIIGVSTLDELIDQTVPSGIRSDSDLNLPPAISEAEFLNDIIQLADKNQRYRSLIGVGFYNTLTPSVILKNIFHNPGWYTQYTPYQAEISQGRLEALLNFQTMVTEITGLEIANASLLDEGTAAFEAMTLSYRMVNRRAKIHRTKFLVSKHVFPTTLDILQNRAPLNDIEIVIGEEDTEPDDSFFGAMFQYPDAHGAITNYSEAIRKWKAVGCMTTLITDLMALCLIESPGAIGADIAVGSTQRFGVPMLYGGPHAAFMATHESNIREMPGRIIGASTDKFERKAYRMALQTREQHIKREKATSNICTAQALLAIMASMYAVYHGAEGLVKIASDIKRKTDWLNKSVSSALISQTNKTYFDTLKFELDGKYSEVKSRAAELKYNLLFNDEDKTAQLSIDESVTSDDLKNLVMIFTGVTVEEIDWCEESGNVELPRTSPVLKHPIFSSFHSETEMMRYLKKLENKDLSLTLSMIPLGSCTMKLNPASCMLAVCMDKMINQHPFSPIEQNMGYSELIERLSEYLVEITGFHGISLQPNSGAQGEYAGLRVIQAYHESRGDKDRDIVLIPASSHGTNPASTSVCGMEAVIIKSDEQGNVSLDDLTIKIEKYRDRLSGLMITYPSTHGVFEEEIVKICDLVHHAGGQVYMDGANMNAQVGLTSPGRIGADVCHLNLHKTFSIPHGGGGPGVGPICVAKHLTPFLPSHSLIKTGGEKAIGAVSSAPWGSAGILPISYGYIRMLGSEGCSKASQVAILSSNYMKARLEKYFEVLYQGESGRVAHELIVDLRPFKKTSGVEAVDVSKRLMDYGFHAPTLSFPVSGTLMIEPTESESLYEIDRFCDAMIKIREEIAEIEEGKSDSEDNVLKNAPHSMLEITDDVWDHGYSREKAAYPVPSLKLHKFWTNCSRINDAYGDRHLICNCPPIEQPED